MRIRNKNYAIFSKDKCKKKNELQSGSLFWRVTQIQVIGFQGTIKEMF